MSVLVVIIPLPTSSPHDEYTTVGTGWAGWRCAAFDLEKCNKSALESCKPIDIWVHYVACVAVVGSVALSNATVKAVVVPSRFLTEIVVPDRANSVNN